MPNGPIKDKIGDIKNYTEENWNREGNRGASIPSIQIGEGGRDGSGSVSWAISKEGRNDDTDSRPRVKDNGHSKPTLGDY